MDFHRYGFLLAGLFLGAAFFALSAAAQSPAAPGTPTLHVMPQSHIDLAWWWRYDPETIDVVVKHTLETAFDNMNKYPEYTFSYLQVPAIEPLETRYPDLFYKLRYYVHRSEGLGCSIPNPGACGDEGRLAIASGFYCEVDGSVPSGESLVRQCLYGKRYFQKHFGLDVKTAWVMDAWTHPWTLPQILQKSGMDTYLFSRPREAGDPFFWWEGLDGSRVLAGKPLESGGEHLSENADIQKYLDSLRQRYGITQGFTLIGVGNHGGGALKADVERMRRRMQEKKASSAAASDLPVIRFSTPGEFLAALRKENPNFPVWRNEIEPTLRGAYTTVGEVKRGNRYSENLLLTLEKFSVIADRLRVMEYPSEWLAGAWQKILLNQFHDTISGTDVPPSIDDALRRYMEVLTEGEKALNERLAAIASRIDTREEGMPVVVFNPLSWERSGVVEVMIGDIPEADAFTVTIDGEKSTAQILRRESREGFPVVFLAFPVKSVPSMGYVVGCINHDRDKKQAKETAAPPCALSNEFFEITIDPVSGDISRIYDKQAHREVLAAAGGGNQIQILEDFGDSEGFLKDKNGAVEHNTWDGNLSKTDEHPRMDWVEKGPLRKTIEIRRVFGLARFIQRISLTAGSPVIDFSLDIDWEGQDKMVKTAFPLGVTAPSATYEIPYGNITRPSRGEEENAQNWVELSDGGYGVALINDSRYGYDVTENTIRLSLLRSPSAPVAAKDDGGVHRVRYQLYPHIGDWRVGRVVQAGQELNNALRAMGTVTHRGDLPKRHSFCEVYPADFLLTTMKQAEDSRDIILRGYECEGKACTLRIRWSPWLTPDAVYHTNLLEQPDAEIPSKCAGMETAVGAYAIETFQWIKDPD